MSDIGDDFKVLRELGASKRAHNREASARILRERGISFASKNEGAHLIVKRGDHVADLWPGTGKWIVRARAEYAEQHGRGVFQLIDKLRSLDREKGK